MIYRFILFVVFTVMFIAPTCFASDISGTYVGNRGGGINAKLKLNALAGGKIAVYILIDSGGCAGEFEGKGTMQGNVITATKKFENEICKLTLKVNGEKIEIEEENCLAWHGVRCSFEGTFIKIAK